MNDDVPHPGEPEQEAPMTQEGLVEPVAVGPGDHVAPPGNGADGEPSPAIAAEPGVAATDPAPDQADPADASLLALVDRLAAILERSDLGELEVAAGDTTIILRSPAAIERAEPAGAGPAVDLAIQAADGGAPSASAATAQPAAAATAPAARPSVKAPLTGIFYGAPSPGATPYVATGDHVAVGQIIGLIEAMKLYNEIKSDLAGRVVRVCVDNGALVKARQPLIEAEPA